ncbi:Predicted arabinose efflux permease, MFS family [Pasteurella testudinis DSM 23072]|uniref:Predicted arabinose efflux permease, MFS family n=1 Tax=Pasteurella testudinis DSM 23072 TaxID=1122938 RepID=A0A1W1UV53_9PAST|nr:MFS transporter [Pasteurella testudinis]SMB84594.1 Predicted arabinose efflux permease, MFS family [Pasteurella testudinis DSM 23072]SUB52937.1 Inner membrane protein yhjX [Pasteurella testudinis]
MTANTRRFALIILAAAAILMITMGMRMALGLFVQPIHQDTALSITAISFAMAITQLMWGVAQPITGALADRYSAWPVMLWGTLLLAAGFALIPLFPSAFGLTLNMGVLVAFGAGAGSFSILISQVSNKLPQKMRGLASGIVNAGGSFGQFLFAPLVQGLIMLPMLGWRGAMYALAIISLLVLPIARWLSRGDQPPKTVPSTVGQTQQSLKQAVLASFKDRSYILLHLGFFTCGFHIAFLVTHLPTEVSLSKLSADVASWSLAIIGISNVVGSLVVGWLVGHYRSKYILFWMYASRAVLIGIYLLMPSSPMTFYLFAVGLGLTWLATVPPTAATVGKLFGVRYLATLFGLTLLSHQVGGFFGAYLGGLAITQLGDYSWMWYADMILAALAAVLNLPIREEKIVRTELHAKSA